MTKVSFLAQIWFWTYFFNQIYFYFLTKSFFCSDSWVLTKSSIVGQNFTVVLIFDKKSILGKILDFWPKWLKTDHPTENIVEKMCRNQILILLKGWKRGGGKNASLAHKYNKFRWHFGSKYSKYHTIFFNKHFFSYLKKNQRNTRFWMFFFDVEKVVCGQMRHTSVTKKYELFFW